MCGLSNNSGEITWNKANIFGMADGKKKKNVRFLSKTFSFLSATALQTPVHSLNGPMASHEFSVTDLHYCIILGPKREKERMWEVTWRGENSERETEIKLLKKLRTKMFIFVSLSPMSDSS